MKSVDDQLMIFVRQTLRYAEIFGASLTLDQLHARLQGTLSVSMKDLKKVISSSQEIVFRKGFVQMRDAHHFVKSPDLQAWQKKMREARRASGVLSRIPWVLAVLVTGSVAAENVHPDDDVDLMIITARKRLWLSRLLVVPLLILLGKYQDKRQMQTVFPHRSVKTSNRWCLNLWLDESSLQVPKSQQSLYTAHEVLLTKCVYQKKQMGKQFFIANSWIQAYFAHAPLFKETRRSLKDSKNILINFFEYLAYQLQRLYMKKSHTSEKISESFAYFHPRDTASIVLKKFQSFDGRR